MCPVDLAKAAVIFPPCSVVAGCLHPQHQGYFKSPTDYMKWYSQHGPLKSDSTYPTVAVLLYRKHVITEQMYIGQLIGQMEDQGLRPIPIFINGIEAHTVVSCCDTLLKMPLPIVYGLMLYPCLAALRCKHV